MRHPLVQFAIDLGVRTLLAFAIGIATGVVLLVMRGTAAHHEVAQIAGRVTILSFILISAWWLPRLARSEIETEARTDSTLSQ